MAKKAAVKKFPTSEAPSKWKTFSYLVVVVLLFILVPRITSNYEISKFKETTIPEAVKQVLGDPNTKFSVGDVKEKSGVYEFKLAIGEEEMAQEYTSYISKDGKILFTSGIDLEAMKKQTEGQATDTTKKLSCDELDKAETPTLTAFVVADCPFGLQMQRLYNKAITELPELGSSLEVKYIGEVVDGKITAMHGDEEAQENLRQICIREEQPNLYWPYVNCYMKAEGQSQTCLNQAGVNQISLNSCMTDANKGLKYAQADFDLANQFGVTGSPTLILNEKQTVSEFDFGGRVADAVKQIICCGSETKPAYCDKSLSTDEVAAAFSETVESENGGASASCN